MPCRLPDWPRSGDGSLGMAKSTWLEQYETAFRENGVSAEVLCLLTAEDLRELGVAAVGHRRQLLAAIAKLNEQRGTDTVSLVVELATAASGPLGDDAVS